MTSNPDFPEPDFRFPSLSTHPNITNIASSSSTPGPDYYTKPNPRKKRSKLSKSDGGKVSKPKITKKPDPFAPKITRPCTECGKKFWSWKALFGHMRCHPERAWRGINPPPNARRSIDSPATPVKNIVEWSRMTVEDHEVASCLLMLANNVVATNVNAGGIDSVSESDSFLLEYYGGANTKFECTSCKKVFGSHQALGGHRASHKNVKGCFAITKSEGCEIEHEFEGVNENNNNVMMVYENESNSNSNNKMVTMDWGHQCSICLRVFPSGQALGGHKRCHWEKVEEYQPLMMIPSNNDQRPDFVKAQRAKQQQEVEFGKIPMLDLNRPAPVEDDSVSVSSSYSSGLTLDLRLGL